MGEDDTWEAVHSVDAPLSEGQRSAPAPPSPARRYERRATVARGGMGEVDVVRDRWLDRDVARKVILEDRPDDRLAHEARITARLDHPGIISVLDTGVDDDGRRFYTMRLVRGASLGQRLDGAPLEARLAFVRSLLLATQAVDYAHNTGIVHRDLKPDNLTIGQFGEVQVVDWGIAAPGGSPGRAEGTRPYADPAQLDAAPVHPSHDVYALGQCLAHLLRGGVPDGSLPDEAPPELTAIVRQATAPRSARYPDAAALAADLDAWLDGRRVSAHTYSPRDHLGRALRAYWRPLTVAGVAGVGLLALGAWAYGVTWAERDRALAAEAESSERLAALLVDKAVDAFEEGRIEEAEEAAVRALDLVDDPLAHGVLAAAHPPRPERLATGPAPCEGGRLLSDGRVACFHPDLVRLFAGVPATPTRTLRARRALDVVDVGGALVTAEPAPDGGSDLRLRHHRADGTDRSLATVPLGTLSDGGPALLVHHVQGLRVSLDASEPTSWAPCPGTRAPVARPAWDGDRAAWACEGQIAWEDTSGVERTRAVAEGVAALALVGDDVVATFYDGSIGRFGPSGPRWRTAIPGGTSPRLSIDGDRIVVTPEGGGVALLDLRSGHWLGSLPSGERPRAIIQDDRLILLDDRLSSWRLPAASRPHQLQVPGGVTALAFADDGHLAVGAGDTVIVLDPDGATHVWPQGPDCSPVKDVTWSGHRVVRGCATLTRSIGLLDRDGTLHAPERPLAVPRVITLDGAVLAATYGQTQWRLDPDSLALTRQPLPARWLDLEAGPDAAWGLSEDGLARKLGVDGPTGHTLPSGEATSLAVGPADDGILLGTDHTVQRLGARGGTAWTRTVDGRITDVAWAPAGDRVAVGTLSGRAWLLDARDGHTLAVLPGHTQRVSALAFTADGAMLATGSWDRTVRLWSAR